MLISIKQFMLVVVISFISVFFFSFFSNAPVVSITPDQIEEIAFALKKSAMQYRSTGSLEVSEKDINSASCPSVQTLQFENIPTLKQIRQIVRDELANTENPIQAIKTNSIKTNVFENEKKDDEYQQALHDSNEMLSKILSNQTLSKNDREKWGRDHSRLSIEDQNNIVEQIVTAINNQELQLEEPLDLPF